MAPDTKKIVIGDQEIIKLILERIEKDEFPVTQTAAANLAHILMIGLKKIIKVKKLIFTLNF